MSMTRTITAIKVGAQRAGSFAALKTARREPEQGRTANTQRRQYQALALIASRFVNMNVMISDIMVIEAR
jgi:hypothetical protein